MAVLGVQKALEETVASGRLFCALSLCGKSEGACLSINGCLRLSSRPEILKHEMKVFFVKYNDPIYVKLEKLDIMIRLASQANIAQVRLCHPPGRLGTKGGCEGAPTPRGGGLLEKR